MYELYIFFIKFQAQDDIHDNELQLNDFCPNEPSQPITHDTLKILLGKNYFTDAMN